MSTLKLCSGPCYGAVALNIQLSDNDFQPANPIIVGRCFPEISVGGRSNGIVFVPHDSHSLSPLLKILHE